MNENEEFEKLKEAVRLNTTWRGFLWLKRYIKGEIKED